MNLYRLTKDNSIFQNIGFVTHITQTFDIVTLTTSMNFIIDYIIDLLFSLFYFHYSYQYKRIKMNQSKNNFVNSTLLRQITNQWLEWCRSKTSTLFFSCRLLNFSWSLSSAAACLSRKFWLSLLAKKTVYVISTPLHLHNTNINRSFENFRDSITAFHRSMTKPSPMSTFVPVIVILYCTFRHQIEY